MSVRRGLAILAVGATMGWASSAAATTTPTTPPVDEPILTADQLKELEDSFGAEIDDSDRTVTAVACSVSMGTASCYGRVGEVLVEGTGPWSEGLVSSWVVRRYIDEATAATTTTGVPRTTAPDSPLPAAAVCEDETNDGSGGFDLQTASIERYDGAYRALVTYVGPAEGRDVVTTFMLGSFEYQVGAKLYADPSIESDAYVFDLADNTNTDIEDEAIILPNHTSVLIPDALVPRLGGGPVSFTATLTVDGLDIDTC